MTAISVLDDQTTDAIRRALAEASAGRLLSACGIGERALRDGGDVVALNAMLGMLRCRSNDFADALRHLRPAHHARPADVPIAINFVTALVACEEYEEALAIATPERAAADPSLQIARYRGYIAQLVGNAQIAADAYEQVVLAAPDDWQSWNNLGNARLLCGDPEGAELALRRSLELNSDYVPAWRNLAQAFFSGRQFDEAEHQLRMTAERFPDDVSALKDLHEIMRRRGQSNEMIREVLEQAVTRAPLDKDLLLAVGQQRMISGDYDSAEIAFRFVLAADPADGDAYIELAKLYEHSAPEKLTTLAVEAEAARPGTPDIQLLQAFSHRRDKKFAAGSAALDQVPADYKPWLTNELRGQFYDALGQSEAAFAAFTRMNEAQAVDPSNPLARAEHLRSTLSVQLKQLTDKWLAGWKEGPVPGDRPAPVFLVGFPRSGTTLLDTMLMGHDAVAVMEEQPALNAVSREIGGFDAIADLDAHGIRAARTLYFDIAGKSADLDRQVLIDKNPLHLMQVPLIYRLFPDARFLLALRHPADVILSCYFSNFRLTPNLANFLRLDTAAEFYDLAFSTWERARQLMRIEVHTVVYEQLVDDPEAQLRALGEALNLDWRDEMLDHPTTAAARGSIANASYAQVTQPIYASSVGRWARYRKQLEPVFPVIEPWVSKFGYSL